MKINEIEEQLSISRANVRFYEKEGLLNPKRSANGYRDYREEDLVLLKKIIIFRKLGLSIPNIRDILEGTLSLSDAMDQNIKNLNAQIEELNGALEVCKIIEKDSATSTSFNESYYWELIHTKENNGQHFVELVKDYFEFEKQSFIRMWALPFLYDLNGNVKRHGWLIASILLLVVCVIRGLATQFIWKSGSFLYGFSYPFVLFAILSLITFPIFFLHRKYKDIESTEEPKNTKSSPLKAFLKIAAAILYIPFFLFGIPIALESLIFDNLLGKDTAYIITCDLYLLYAFVGMYVFCVFVYLYSKHGILGNVWTGEGGIRASFPRKVKRKIAIGSVLVFLLSILVYQSWFDCFTEDGIRVQRFFYNKEYTWEDVDYYTLTASFDGTLNYNIIMKDGTRTNCLGSGAAMSNLPEETYPNYEEDYGRYLARTFSELNIPLKTDNWNTLMKKLKYDYWEDFAEEIRSISQDN